MFHISSIARCQAFPNRQLLLCAHPAAAPALFIPSGRTDMRLRRRSAPMNDHRFSPRTDKASGVPLAVRRVRINPNRSCRPASIWRCETGRKSVRPPYGICRIVWKISRAAVCRPRRACKKSFYPKHICLRQIRFLRRSRKTAAVRDESNASKPVAARRAARCTLFNSLLRCLCS